MSQVRASGKAGAVQIVFGLLVIGNWVRDRLSNPVTEAGELPLSPEQIDWISAAGNYVELHGRNGVAVHRASLASVERRLKQDGFVRIHRSTLVKRASIARVRPNDVVLHGGTSLKTGERYRSTLANFAP